MCNTYNRNYPYQNVQNYCGCHGVGTLWVFLFGNNGCYNRQRVCRDCNGNLHIIDGYGCTAATTYPQTGGCGYATGTANACFGTCANTTANTAVDTTANGNNYTCGYYRVRTCGCYGYSI